MFETLVTIVHILTCTFLILVVLLQSGKGGGVSAAFGGGAGSAIGQRGAATVLSKMTTGAAGTFMFTSMILAVYASPSADDPAKKFLESQAGAAAASEPGAAAAPASAAEAPVGEAPAAPASEAPAAPASEAPAGE